VAHDAQDERLIQAVLASGVRIPPMPEILRGLNLLLRDEDAGPRELAGLIGRDGALSGAVFRLVGSPVFGLRARVDTVEKAITVLGIRSAAAVVRSEALRGALHDPGHARALEALWAHSGAIADLMLLALKTGHARGIAADTAYTLGMFHDCGLALLCKRLPLYARALVQPGIWLDIPTLDANHQTDHGLIGQMVAKNWLLGEDIVLAIRHHHSVSVAGLDEAVARLCALLNFALHLRHARTGTEDGTWESAWKAETGRRLGLSEGDLADWEAAVGELAGG
jgi:HD-like signal output (HDOD) protein